MRRYLHEGRLDAERVDMPAGGWQWLIDKASVESLRERLQAGQQGAAVQGMDALMAEVQALRGMVERQTKEIARLTEVVAGLLPPGPEAASPDVKAAEKPRRWWWPFGKAKGG